MVESKAPGRSIKNAIGGLVGLLAISLLVWRILGGDGIDHSKVYRIGYGNDVPFHFTGQNGLPTGLAVELVNEAARRQRVRLQWVPDQHKGFNHYSMDLWVLMTDRPELLETVHITTPYLETESCFIVRAEGAIEITDLQTGRISFIDYATHRKNLAVLLPQAQKIPVKSSREALEKVSAGLADAAYVDQYSAMPGLLEGGYQTPLRIMPSHAPKGRMGLAATLPNSRVADVIRAGMKSMVLDGSITRSVEKWGVFPNLTNDMVENFLTEQRKVRALAISAAIATLGLGGSLWFVRRLRQQASHLRRITNESRKMLSAVEQSPVSVVMLDLWGNITYANPRFCEITGYPQAEILGRNPRILSSGEASLEDYRKLWESVSSGREWRGIIQNRKKNGEFFWESACVAPMFDESGHITDYIGVMEDITAGKQAEAALQRSARGSEQLRRCVMAISACPDLKSALDCLLQKTIELAGADCGAVYVIEGPEAVLRHAQGLTSEFIQEVSRLPLNTGYVRVLLENPQAVLKLGDQFSEQQQLGKLHGIRHLYCLGFGAGQSPVGFLILASRKVEAPNPAELELIHILTTEAGSMFLRFEAEERLRRVSNEQRIILETTAAGIVHIQDHHIQWANPAFELLFGWGRAETVGLATAGFYASPAFYDRVVAESMAHFVAGKTYSAEGECKRRDGKELYCAITGQAVDPANPAAGSIWILVDMTERRQFEQRMRQSQKLEGIGQLAGGMAHEFNNILTAIMMNLELAPTRGTEDEIKGFVREIEALSNRAAALVKQLLAFSRQSVLKLRPLNLATVLSEQSKLLARLLGERISLRFSAETGCPWVNADKTMIEQVLLNLCLNARDAMPNGGLLTLTLDSVEVSQAQAGLHEDASAGRYVRFSVADTGCGMDESTRKRMFEPFFTTKQVGQGTGLGLATVQGIVEQHKGWVEVESVLHQGTVFHVYLPPGQTIAPQPKPIQDETPERGSGCILLVEDEPAVRKVGQLVLNRFGYRVIEAADGEEATRLWQQHCDTIDLVYTDMVMPGAFTGLQLARKFQAEKPGVRIIITSGYNAEMELLGKLGDSAIVYLPKPCSAAKLISVIQESLGRR